MKDSKHSSITHFLSTMLTRGFGSTNFPFVHKWLLWMLLCAPYGSEHIVCSRDWLLLGSKNAHGNTMLVVWILCCSGMFYIIQGMLAKIPFTRAAVNNVNIAIQILSSAWFIDLKDIITKSPLSLQPFSVSQFQFHLLIPSVNTRTNE